MAAPQFIAVGAQSAGTGAITVAWNGEQAGDLGILVVESDGLGANLDLSGSGWTPVTGSPRADVASTAGSRLYVFWKFATSSTEADVSIPDLGDHAVARIYAFRDVDPTTPINVTTNDIKTTASNTATFPSVTTTAPNTLVLFIASRPNDTVSTTNFALPVNANLTGLAEAGEGGTNASNGGGFVLSYGTRAVAGAIGTTTMALNISTTNVYFVIALNEISAAPIDETRTETVTATDNSTRDIDTNSDRTEAASAVDTQDATVLSTINEAITEAVTATDTQDFTFAAGGLITESVTATDSAVQTNYISQARIVDRGDSWLMDSKYGWSGSLTSVSGDRSYGMRFVSPQTTAINAVRVNVSNASGSPASTLGRLELWQLTSNSVTALPQTLLFSRNISASELSKNDTTTEFTVPSWAVTSGVGYAIVIRQGSDWDSLTARFKLGNSFLGGIETQIFSQYGGFVTRTGTGAWSSSTGIFAFAVIPQIDTLDVAIRSLTASAAQTETLAAAEDSSAIVSYGVAAEETVTATDTQDSTAAATASQSETLAAAVAEEAQLEAVADRTEAGTAAVAEESQLDTAASTEETVTASDSIIGSAVSIGDVSEAVTATDTQDSTAAATASQSETLTAAVAEEAQLEAVADRTEAGTAEETLVGEALRDADTAETVSAADEADSINSYEVAAEETVTATDSQDFTYAANAEATESVTASDSISCTMSSVRWLLEDNVAFSVYPIRELTMLGGSNTQAVMQAFRAPKTGILGDVAVFLDKANFFGTVPAGLDVNIELWSLATLTGSPQTLLHTRTIPFNSVLTIDQFYSVSFNVSVTQNELYALVIRQPSGASSTTQYLDFGITQLNDSTPTTRYLASIYTTPLKVQPNGSSSWSTLAASYRATTAITYQTAVDSPASQLTSSVSTTEAVSAADEADSTIVYAVDAAETLTATESQDSTLATNGLITEAVTASDASTRLTTFFGLIDGGSLDTRLWPNPLNEATTTPTILFVATSTTSITRLDVPITNIPSDLAVTGIITLHPANFVAGTYTSGTILATKSVSGLGVTPFLNVDLNGFNITAGQEYAIRLSINASPYSPNNVLRSSLEPTRVKSFGTLVYSFKLTLADESVTDTPLGGFTAASGIAETLSASDTSDSTINKTFEVDITEFDDATDFTRAYGPTQNTETVVEELFARESIAVIKAHNCFALDDSIAKQLFLPSAYGGSGLSFLVGAGSYASQAFTPQSSGLLGLIEVRGGRFNTGFSLPTTNGTVEIWVANPVTALPDTLLGSVPWDLSSFGLSITSQVLYDFSSQGIYLSAQTLYCLVLRTGSTWSSSTQSFGIPLTGGTTSTQGLSWLNGVLSTEPFVYRFTGGSGSFSTSSRLSFNAYYQDAIEQQTTGPIVAADITESLGGTLSDSADSTLLDVNKVFESVAPTDSSTALATARAWVTEANSGNELIDGLYNVGTYSSFTISFNSISRRGIKFIANQTANLGQVLARVSRGNSTQPYPTQPGTVELWQLSSNTLSGSVPQTLLASFSFSLTPITSTSAVLWPFNFTGVPGASVTAGVGYAVIFRAGSDWNATTTSILRLHTASTTNVNEVNYFRNQATFIFSQETILWQELGSSDQCQIAIQRANVTTDSALSGFDAAVSIAETATATEDSSTVLAAVGEVAEVEIATDTVTAIYDTFSEITETLNAADEQDETRPGSEAPSLVNAMPLNTLTLNATGYYEYGFVDEAGLAEDTPTAIFTSSAERTEEGTVADDATGSNVIFVSASEDISADDSSFNLVVFDGLLAETLTAADFVDTTLTAVGLATETLSAADSINRAIVADVDIQETLAPTDTQNSVFRSNNQTIESAAATDSPESINTVRAHNTEGGVLVDTIYNTASSNAQSSNSFGIEFTASKTTSIRNVTVRMRRSLSDQPDPTLELWQGATLVASMAISYNSISTSSSNYVVEVGGLGFNIVSGLQYSIRINATNTSGIVRVYYNQLTNTNTTAFSPWYVNLSATAGITNFPADPLQINLFRLLEDVVVDAADGGLAQSGSISEATLGSDTQASQVDFIASGSEPLSATDLSSNIRASSHTAEEVVAANDSLFSQLILTVEVVDPLAASDSALGGLSTLASASALVLAAVDGDLLYTPFIDLEYVLTGSLAADVEDGYVQTLVDLDYSEAVIKDSEVAISQDIDYINAYAKPDYIQMSVEVVQPNTVEYVEYVRLAGAA